MSSPSELATSVRLNRRLGETPQLLDTSAVYWNYLAGCRVPTTGAARFTAVAIHDPPVPVMIMGFSSSQVVVIDGEGVLDAVAIVPAAGRNIRPINRPGGRPSQATLLRGESTNGLGTGRRPTWGGIAIPFAAIEPVLIEPGDDGLLLQNTVVGQELNISIAWRELPG